MISFFFFKPDMAFLIKIIGLGESTISGVDLFEVLYQILGLHVDGWEIVGALSGWEENFNILCNETCKHEKQCFEHPLSKTNIKFPHYREEDSHAQLDWELLGRSSLSKLLNVPLIFIQRPYLV